MRKSEIIKKETTYLIYFSFIGRILIMVKDILIASIIGVCCEMDNYVLALTTIMFPTKIVADAIIISMIPLLQIVKEEEGESRRIDHTNNIINITMVMATGLMIIGYILAPIIISLFGPGLKTLELEETIGLFRLGLPIIILSWFRAVTGGYLQSEHAFRAGAKGLVSNPLIFIIYLLLFRDSFGIEGLMIIGSIAILSQAYILFSAMRKKGFKYKWKFNIKERYLKKMLVFFLPLIAGFGINEINMSIDNAIASTLGSGSIAELNYANDIISLFLGIFVVAIVTVIFPILTESHNKEDMEELRDGIRYGISSILHFAVPVSIILVTMSAPIVKLFFERGAFDAQATFFTAQALTYYSIGFIALTFIPMITRGYYSIHKMKTPFYLGLLMFLVNLLLNLILSPRMGGAGIALSTSISSIVFVVIGFYGLNKRLRFLNYEDFGEKMIKISVAAVIMFTGIILTYGIIATSFPHTFINNIITVGLSAGVGVGLYMLVYRVLKV